ncbi:copper transporter 1-like [Juglans regia]|uniref:Copper transport protein n=1 Tax=Juglans regia TaxID=51240 RepID=A0A2I4DEB8_JUGRE|nr:copper transporter 1-like [Juglans regia]
METTSHHGFGAFNGTGDGHMRHRRMMMHMSFYWGHKAEVLFSGWPGTSSVMYPLALAFVFVLAVLVEWLSHCNIIKPGTNNLAVGLMQTAMYTVRSGLDYMVMLAVMSFNGGVFLAVVGGRAVGFLVFGSRAFRKTSGSASGSDHAPSDLPPMKC